MEYCNNTCRAPHNIVVWNRTKIVEEEHGGYCSDYYGRPIDTPYEEWIDDCNILECPGKNSLSSCALNAIYKEIIKFLTLISDILLLNEFRLRLTKFIYLTVICCDAWNITSTGSAKEKQAVHLGIFDYHVNSTNLWPVYRNSENRYLFLMNTGAWVVS